MWAVTVPSVVFQCRLQKLKFLKWHSSVGHFQLRFSSGIPVWDCFNKVFPAVFQCTLQVFAGSPSGIPVYTGSTSGIPVAFQPVYTGSGWGFFSFWIIRLGFQWLRSSGSANAQLPGYFRPGTLSLNIGLNMLSSDSFVSCLHCLQGCYTGESQALGTDCPCGIWCRG